MGADFSCLLDNRGIIHLGGADRRAFLQGLISNDTNLCTQDRAVYAALLTPQGKFLHDLFIIENGEEFLIDCEADRAEDLLKRLAAYKLRAKVTMRDGQGEFEVWAIGGQKTEDRGQKIFADPRLPELGFRAILKKGDLQTPNPGPRTLYDRRRLALGVADGSRDMLIEKSTLAEGNFDLLNGISWSKGCYVGQELTARVHYRGLAKKRLFPVTIDGDAPAFGAPVTLNGEEIGDMRSNAGGLGLALLNVEKAEMAMREQTALACGASRLTVSRPGWMDRKD
jgi:folate-binding protein YgfZ